MLPIILSTVINAYLLNNTITIITVYNVNRHLSALVGILLHFIFSLPYVCPLLLIGIRLNVSPLVFHLYQHQLMVLHKHTPMQEKG